jgi:hypothetical protein
VRAVGSMGGRAVGLVRGWGVQSSRRGGESEISLVGAVAVALLAAGGDD